MFVESSPQSTLPVPVFVTPPVHSPRVVINRPVGMGAFQFVALATLRAVQLTRGCVPRVDGDHKKTVIAQQEVAQGKVLQVRNADGSV